MLKKFETYKGIDIAIGIVCYNFRYFVMNEHFRHFESVEKARKHIDKMEDNVCM